MFNSSVIKIIVAEDCKLFKEGIITLLNSIPNFLVIDEAENGRELIEKYVRSSPDLILSSMCMSPISGIQAVSKIKKINSDVRVLFLSVSRTEENTQTVIEAGGLGLVDKYIGINELAYAIKTVITGNYYFGRVYSKSTLKELKLSNNNSANEKGKNPIDQLSKKEREIINLLASGLTTKEISKNLFVSKRTVDKHRMNIIQKLNLRGSAELLKFAFEYVNNDDIN